MRKLGYISFLFASAVVGATVAASVAGGAPASWRPVATTTPPTTATESTSSTTTAITAKGKIAYSVPTLDGPLDWDVFVMNADGSGVRRLTYDPAPPPDRAHYDDAFPSWSPDGRMLAFEHGSGINVIEADGKGVARTIVRNGFRPAWSPNGRKIAFGRNDFGGISVVRPDGTGLRKLTPRGDGNATWSPNGRRIAYARHYLGEFFARAPKEIRVMNSDGRGKKHVLARRGASEPAWSPNGRKIVFKRKDGIYLMNSDGSHQVRLRSQGESLAWSPDGHQIAFSIRSGKLAGLWIMNADGSGQQRVIAATDIAGISWAKAQ